MSSRAAIRLEAWFTAIVLASLAAIAAAAVAHLPAVAAVAAATFAITTIAAGITATAAPNASSAHATLLQTTRLSVWTLAWAAAALFIAYPIAGLRWQHGWQYASGYALLAAAFALYLRRLTGHGAPLFTPAAEAKTRTATLLFALAILIAAGWLIGSGKLLTTRQDWLANDIFLATAAAIFALSVTFLWRTRRR